MPSFLSSEPLHVKTARELHAPPAKDEPHSIAVPGSATPDRTPIYRHYKFASGPIDTLDPTIQTSHDLFEAALRNGPNKPFLGARPYNSTKKTWGPYEWQDYETVAKRRKALGAGIAELLAREGLSGKQRGIGLWCQNRPEWTITDLACMSQGLFTVSLYDTLGPDAAEYIINHAELPVVVTSLAHVSKLIKLKPRLPSLKSIIVLDNLDATTNEDPTLSKRTLLENMSKTFELDLKILSMSEVEIMGDASGRQMVPPTSEDIITINYTSGTTGPPKGVVLTHKMCIAATTAGAISSSKTSGDTLCSYLPLAHIYGRLLESLLVYGNGKTGSFHGNILELVDDLKALRPTTFTSVPRLYNRFGGVVKASTIDAPGFKGNLSTLR